MLLQFLQGNKQNTQKAQGAKLHEKLVGLKMAKLVKLLSGDEVSYEIPIEVARVSDTLNAMMGDNEYQEGEVLELKMVKSNVLEKVIQWCSHHRGDGDSDSGSATPANSEDDEDSGGDNKNGEMTRKRRKDKIDSWDIRFLDEQIPATLFDLLVAARDLGIKVLLDMTCKLVYGLMKDQTPQEVRENCGIECTDVKLMEIEKIIKENDG